MRRNAPRPGYHFRTNFSFRPKLNVNLGTIKGSIKQFVSYINL